MVLSFKYGPVPFAKVVEPIIPVVFINEKDENDFVGYGMLVDSGADYSILSPTMADRLNINYKGNPARKITGIGGLGKGILADVGIILHRGAETYRYRISVYVLIEPDLVYPLLGRIPTFDYFDVSFRQRKLEIHFQNKSLKKILTPEKLLTRWQRAGNK